MVGISFSWNEIGGIVIVAGFGLTPVVATTFLAYRSFRRGWWLAGPGGLFLVLSPLLTAIFYATGAVERSESTAFAISLALFIASWIATGLFLAALAIAGPKLPVIDVQEVF